MKKRIITLFMAVVMIASCLAGMILPLSGTTVIEESEVSKMETVDTSVYVMSDVRNRIPFNSGWKFIKQDVSGAEQMNFDDSAWEDVSLPHSWTKEDYNTSPYYQGEAWYRKTFEVGARSEYQNNNKRLWVEFEACGKYAQVYINGNLLGNHIGGYSAFRYDITDYLTATGTNVIAVLANNSSRGSTIAPMGMDFDNWGGLYRDAWLIETANVGVDMSDYGASAFYISADKDENSDNWALNVSTNVVNVASKKVTAEAEIIFRYPKRSDLTWMDASYDISSTAAKEIGSDENPFLFDPDKMYETFENEKDYIIEKRIVPLSIAADSSVTVNEDFTVEDPKLWNGVYSPYRYVAEISVKVDGKVVDHVKDFFGFRYFKVDDTGFYLNGEPYKLKGVNKHQDFGKDENGEIIGVCTTNKELYIDLCIAYEMGANYLRLAHYPHDKAFYDMCDAYGICVSGEFTLGGHIGGKTTFDQKDSTTKKYFSGMETQLEEFIKQQHNNPSIIIWGLSNEINPKYYDTMLHYHAVLNDLAHELDGNHRYTSVTICVDEMVGLAADLIAWNTYPQWYFEFTYEEFATKLYNDFKNDQRYANYLGIAVTEYGAGSNVLHHTDILERPATGGQWHPEEWANYVHEDALLALENIDYLWVSSPWVLFDFPSAGRNEGDLIGMNDKGLVNLDRTLKKDTFYLYKANYSEVPFVYFAENRFTPRDKNEITVKCYSNADSIKLYKMMNGEKTYLCDMQSQGAGIFLSPKLPLYFGDNEYIAEFEENGKTYTATCTFASTSDKTPTLPDIPETEAPKTETTAPDTVEETTASVGETTVTPNSETTVTPEVETTESPEGNATDAPEEGTAKVDASADDTTTAETSGCKSAVGAAAATAALITAAGAVALKKKED